MSELNRWQDPENGFPLVEYFNEVAKAVIAAGVAVETGWREELWDATLSLGHGFRRGYESLYVGWRVDEESTPLTGDWRPLHSGICGWHWVPYRDAQSALGERAEPLDVGVLAEPEQVAAAVAALVRPGGEG